MKITSQIHLIKSLFEIPVAPGKFLPRFVNSYIIMGKKIHLADTGVAASFVAIEKCLNENGRDIREVASVLLTHSHPDHIGAARQIKEISGCKVYAHWAEKSWIENTALQFSQRPVPGFGELVGGPVPVDFEINDGQILSLEPGLEIKCIHTPGHSAGSVSFFFEKEKILFSGDAVLLPGELPVFENTEEYFCSVQKINCLSPALLLSAWDSPREKEEIPVILENSKLYIKKIQQVVRKIASYGTDTTSMDFCFAAARQLGLPEAAVNPLLLKSFRACL